MSDPTNPVAPQNPEHPLFPATLGDPSAPSAAPEPELTPEQKELKELRERFEAQQQDWNQREQQYQQRFDMLLSRSMQPAAPAAQEPAAPQLPGFDDLPDPVQSPTEYHKKLSERIQQREAMLSQHLTNSVQQNVLSQVTRGQVLDNVWNRFAGAHPELAKRQALLQGVAAVTFNELRARGVDPISYASQAGDSLIATIAQRMNAELGITPTAPATLPGGGSAARAAGIAGGSVTPTPTAPAPAQPSSFVEQLRKAQQVDGLL
ncbi:MAG TPA: hypothetical protein VFY39_04565 [Gammaproteobacteria bacterium]|nr:hypothetical protein [Gammaproteobacteria bacterium]